MKFAAKCLFTILLFVNYCHAQSGLTTESMFGQAVLGAIVPDIGTDIRCILQDSKNNMWFATNGQGVFKYDGKKLVRFTEQHGLCCNFVWNIQEAKDGVIWFKTQK